MAPNTTTMTATTTNDNKNDDNNNNTMTMAIQMVPCEDCGHDIPESNVMIHKLHACPGRRPSQQQQKQQQQQQQKQNNNDTGNAMDVDQKQQQQNQNQPVHDLVSPSHPSSSSRSTVVEGTSSNNSNNNNNNAPSPGAEASSSRATMGMAAARTILQDGDDDDSVIDLMSSDEDDDENCENQSYHPNNNGQPVMRRRQRQRQSIIDLAHSPPAAPTRISSRNTIDDINYDYTRAAAAAAATSQPTNSHEWSCPKCTLLNSMDDMYCDACRYRRRQPSTTTTSPATSRRRHHSFSSPSSLLREGVGVGGGGGGSTMAVGGGALLGGMLGAAGSFLQGRDPFIGAAEGAMTGGMGGIVLQNVLHQQARAQRLNNNNNNNNIHGQQQQQPQVVSTAAQAAHAASASNGDVAQARSSAAMGMAGYPSMMESASDGNRNNDPHRRTSTRLRPRASYRVIQRRDQGFTTTIIAGGGLGGSTRVSMNNNDNEDDPFLRDPIMGMLFHSYLQQEQNDRNAMDMTRMDYEQLLQAFGDGTERMQLGADEGMIRQLPTHTVERIIPANDGGNGNQEEHVQTCLICLSDYEVGDVRKMLPCVHGFHETCIDQWLRTNGSCPICKHKLSSHHHQHHNDDDDGNGHDNNHHEHDDFDGYDDLDSIE